MPTKAASLPTQRYMRNTQLAAHLGISPMTLSRWKKDPDLKTPPPMLVNDLEHNDREDWDRWLRDRAITRTEGVERSRRRKPNTTRAVA